MFHLRKCRLGIVGLGYVGLPLAVEFGKHFDTVASTSSRTGSRSS